MNAIIINANQCRDFGKVIRNLKFTPESFTDPLLYPSPRLSSHVRANFYFFMVAIDHQTHPQGEIFEAEMGSRLLRGAELLYALALRRLYEDELSFDPKEIASMSLNEFKVIFTAKTPRNTIVTVKDPETRLQLWHDASDVLLRRNCTGILEYLERVRQHRNMDALSVNSVLESLRSFRAYQDPVMKKSYLLLKFLLRSKLVTVTDPSALQLPIDNHLIRLALRIGLVDVVDDELKQKIVLRKPFTAQEDQILRNTIKNAYDLVLESSGMQALFLDDLFWHVGRTCCQIDAPNCMVKGTDPMNELKEKLRLKTSLYCPFMEICLSSSDVSRQKMVEPVYLSVYY